MFVENKTTEFKREYVEDIKNTIVAFADNFLSDMSQPSFRK